MVEHSSLLLFVVWSIMNLCINCHLLQKEVFLMSVESYTDTGSWPTHEFHHMDQAAPFEDCHPLDFKFDLGLCFKDFYLHSKSNFK